MSKVASLPRTVGWTVAITAPLAAALTVVVSTLFRRPTRASRARPSIHDVPPRPALWDARGTSPVARAASLREVPPVPPENNHAPPTPPHGIPRQVS